MTSACHGTLAIASGHWRSGLALTLGGIRFARPAAAWDPSWRSPSHPSSRPCSSAGRPSAGGSQPWARPRFASFAGAFPGTGPLPITLASSLPAVDRRGRLRSTSATQGDGLAWQLRLGDGWSRRLFIVSNFLAGLARSSPFGLGSRLRTVVVGDLRGDLGSNYLALAPLAWLMARFVYQVAVGGPRSSSPCRFTRRAWRYERFVEMREMFTQTIGALAEAVDKRDPYTAKHSHRVKEISVDIGRVMRVNDGELEALEWGGLLHDVGKIGVPDAVLLKQEKLTKEERIDMNAAPGPGRRRSSPRSHKLAAELPIIRHHHEWYNGSGYPDRLIGDEIPKLARILHVADAFEAMTAARPYRMTPLTPRAGARRAAQVRRHPVRPGRRRRLRQDALGRRVSDPGPPCPSRPRSRSSARWRPGCRAARRSIHHRVRVRVRARLTSRRDFADRGWRQAGPDADHPRSSIMTPC